MRTNSYCWLTLIALNLICLGGGWFYSQTTAAPPEVRQPFANPVEQREAMIRLLQESNQLLREQNALLKSGKLQVEVVEKK